MQSSSSLRPVDPVTELYVAHAARLRRIVSAGIRAQDAVIDDACQVAWSRLIPRVGRVRPEAALSWLVTTASREALKLVRHEQREASLEELSDEDGWLPEVPGPEATVALREQLSEVHELPVRQQELVWLFGLGFSYEEMADYTELTRRTVERQLLRAKRTLRAAA